jgi:AbiU2
MQIEREILALRGQVKAADEEFHVALAFHEAWKPAAYDQALHERIGRSYAANTFRVIAAALRREMLLALMRLWDSDPRSVRMRAVGESLQNSEVADELTADVARQWDQPIDPSTVADFPKEHRAQMLHAIRRSEAGYGREMAEIQRGRIAEAISLIQKYVDGEGEPTFRRLKRLRNKRLAHREIEARTAASAGAESATDKEVEMFYQDMSQLIRLLKGAVERTSYNPDETARIHAENAALFWADVKGERTAGHPNYRQPRA